MAQLIEPDGTEGIIVPYTTQSISALQIPDGPGYNSINGPLHNPVASQLYFDSLSHKLPVLLNVFFRSRTPQEMHLRLSSNIRVEALPKRPASTRTVV